MSIIEKTNINTLNILDSLKSFNPAIEDNRPAFFTSAEEEYNALYYGAGLRVLPKLSLIELAGNDVLDFLHRITTNNTKELPKGKLVETVFVSEKGRVLDKALLLNLSDKQILLCSDTHKHRLQLWIDKYTISDDVKILTDLSPKAVFGLYGQQAESFLEWACSNFTSLENDSFTVTSVKELSLILLKTTFNNRPGFYIIIDFIKIKELISYFLADKGIYDFALVGEDAFSAYKIEQGIVEAPNELNDKYNPYELGLKGLIDFKKGCYIGQEVIARLDTYDKVQRSLKGINLPCDFKFRESLPLAVFNEAGEEAGSLTSVAFSPRHKKNIGLGIIRNSANRNEKYFIKDDTNKNIEITLTELPFRK